MQRERSHLIIILIDWWLHLFQSADNELNVENYDEHRHWAYAVRRKPNEKMMRKNWNLTWFRMIDLRHSQQKRSMNGKSSTRNHKHWDWVCVYPRRWNSFNAQYTYYDTGVYIDSIDLYAAVALLRFEISRWVAWQKVKWKTSWFWKISSSSRYLWISVCVYNVPLFENAQSLCVCVGGPQYTEYRHQLSDSICNKWKAQSFSYSYLS